MSRLNHNIRGRNQPGYDAFSAIENQHPQHSRCHNDARVFSIARRSSLHGYDAFPYIDDGLSFDLPYFSSYAGRLVEIEGRVWELWSPNSSRLPFFPGERDLDCPLLVNPLSRNRRCDGHLGRFDFTVSPQCYEHPWRAFVLRTLPQYSTIHQFPEFARVHDVWVDEPSPATETGMLPGGFLKTLSDRNDFLDNAIQTLTIEWITRFRDDCPRPIAM